ncbi:M14 family metallopeptidase [Deminuibacter soli]|uniref:Uncharacterized protein n=1 Tax=Deminuibacter soli TaxID=2291815 RepID=A0A3E1NL27_9BACT|nr:M14 family metallopeptidase [Deminuibacter soli]RFM28640.1 hypothetical protein DXN05_07550 [Deminuibacter soli]
MKKPLLIAAFFTVFFSRAQNLATPFEKSREQASATYFESIAYYRQLQALFSSVHIRSFDTTDAGYPLSLVIYSKDKQFTPSQWRAGHKVVILVNNGIHPGEPDGIDASMQLLRDLLQQKIATPDNVVLAIIPVYNIGGSLNRGSFSRVNQNGPEAYGFRGNAQNLDLNRDFIKADSKDAIAFTHIFQWLQPDIFIDNHVSDGADYQHTMTLLTTQHNKLGGNLGEFLHNRFEPALYKGMQQKKWDLVPYVNFEEGNPEKGWMAFYDPPRYSSGYATLFQTLAFMPETHMLKPYADRVHSTYALMQTMMEQASLMRDSIIAERAAAIAASMQQQNITLSWQADTTQFEYIRFKGYATATKTSDVTGMPRMYYDHSQPFEKDVRFYNTFKAAVNVQKPRAYIIPRGWQQAIERLAANGVQMTQFTQDTTITVSYYHIDDYKAQSRAFEKHHRNTDIKLSEHATEQRFVKGDYIVYTGQRADRYIMETLEPLGDDSFFSWNFFDAVLQQKEGYSNYRWEDVAGPYLQQHPELQQQLEAKRKADPLFAGSASAQLDFVYKHSPWYEPAHLRYPVYRLN